MSEQPQQHGLEHQTPRNFPNQDLTLLQSMPLTEAELAKLKLESEGIACVISGANASVMHPLAFSQVRLLVQAADLEEAREVLARPADTDMEGEYVDETWRCPKCHRKTIKLLPAAGLRLMVWYVWWGAVSVFFTCLMLSWSISGDPDLTKRFEPLLRLPLTACLIAFPLATFFLIFASRERACTHCGWKSTDPA